MAPKPEAPSAPEIDFSLESWIYNARSVLFTPFRIISLAALIVIGTFAEMAPRKSLDLLDNVVGTAILFLAPFFFAYTVDWPIGLLAAVVSLIVFARLQKDDKEEGFTSESEYPSGMTTKVVESRHRWFVEKVLGERPVAIASDRVVTGAVSDADNRTSSSSSMATSGSSDSTA
jgi:hypothetical protein